MSQKTDIILHLNSPTDSSVLEQFICLQERTKITGAVIIDADGITQHASNYRTIMVQNGAGTSTYFTWNTKTGENGTLTAGTKVTLVDGGATDEPEFEAGTLFKVRSAASGAGKPQNSVVVLQCEQLRKYS